MRPDGSLLPEAPIPPLAPHAVRRRALWQLLCGLVLGMLPLLLVISFFSLGWIDYNFLGGQCAGCSNGTGLPLFYVTVGLFGVVWVAIPVCVISKSIRFIGWGLFLAAFLTIVLVIWYVSVIPSMMD